MKNKIFLILLIPFTLFAQVSTGDKIKANDFNNSTFQIGDIKHSILTESKFQGLHGDCWVLMSGQDISSTDLGAYAEISNLPNITSNGEFLRQATSSVSVGTIQLDAIRNIKGKFGAEGFSRDTGDTSSSGALYQESRKHRAYGGAGYSGSVQIGLDASRGLPEGTTTDPITGENRPKNLSVNMFVKIKKKCN